jgi:protein-disulfide isomerase/Na+-transporting methylmalonyl-CoA/oxaloacetate decarboxylase gamma subunit
MRKEIFILLILVFAVVSASAQTRRTTPRSPAPKPTPAATSTPKTNTPVAQTSPNRPTDSTNGTVAIVNDVTITAADIQEQVNTAVLNDADPFLRAFYENRETAIKEARQRALEARVNSLLMAAEAKKRGMSSEELINREIDSKVGAPSEAEIRATFDANRAQLGNADLETVRPQLVNYIKGQRSEELYNTLLNRLKMTNAVMKGADVNAPNPAPGTVLASVNGQPIRVEVINERMKSYIYKLDMRIYNLQKQVLDRRINDLLIVAESNKRKVGPEEIVRTEITEKIKAPTEAEINKFYAENKERINGDLASTRTSISTYLQQQQQEQLEKELADRLRASARLQLFLKEPEQPAMVVAVGNGAVRGDPNAAVTVIEFTDFQCSACGAMYPVLEDVLKSYGNRVRFVIRNFPLTRVHENALRAAQAAEAAKAQGKFWEYIDLLFKNQTALDADSLKKFATQVGMDRKRFDAELESGKYEADIRRDLEEGEAYGIEATPTIYINGVMLTEFSQDGLHAAIDKAFARARKR